MAYIAPPSGVRTTSTTVGYEIPQAISSPPRGARTALRLGYGNWRGVAEVVAAPGAENDMLAWAARLADGTHWTEFFVGGELDLPVLSLTFVSVQGSSNRFSGDTAALAAAVSRSHWKSTTRDQRWRVDAQTRLTSGQVDVTLIPDDVRPQSDEVLVHVPAVLRRSSAIGAMRYDADAITRPLTPIGSWWRSASNGRHYVITARANESGGAGDNIDLTFAPALPAVVTNELLDYVAHVRAYPLIEDASGVLAVTRRPEWNEPMTIAWTEYISG